MASVTTASTSRNKVSVVLKWVWVEFEYEEGIFRSEGVIKGLVVGIRTDGRGIKVIWGGRELIRRKSEGYFFGIMRVYD